MENKNRNTVEKNKKTNMEKKRGEKKGMKWKRRRKKGGKNKVFF